MTKTAWILALVLLCAGSGNTHANEAVWDQLRGGGEPIRLVHHARITTLRLDELPQPPQGVTRVAQPRQLGRGGRGIVERPGEEEELHPQLEGERPEVFRPLSP